jgi:hypothetical protein
MTMTFTEPPSERPLSPTRQARLTAQVLRQANEHKRPGWAVPSVAAAVTALLIAGVAAAPTLRSHSVPAAATPGPHVLVASYTDDQGRRVWDPRSQTYLGLPGNEQLPSPSPDGRWTAVGRDTFDEVRIGTPAQVKDRAVGQVDRKALLSHGSLTRGSLWSADSSRYYVAADNRIGGDVWVLGIDPASHRVVSSTRFTVPRDNPGWYLVSADPRTGFVALRDGVLLTYGPTGRKLGERRVFPPNPPRTFSGGSPGILSPDGRRLAVNRLENAHGLRLLVGSIDLRTGRAVYLPAPAGNVVGWADAEHYIVSAERADMTTEVSLVEADTGKVLRSGHLTDPAGHNLRLDQVIPLTGPAPPGAITF